MGLGSNYSISAYSLPGAVKWPQKTGEEPCLGKWCKLHAYTAQLVHTTTRPDYLKQHSVYP